MILNRQDAGSHPQSINFHKPSKNMKDINVSRYNYDSTGTAAAFMLIAILSFASYMIVGA